MSTDDREKLWGELDFECRRVGSLGFMHNHAIADHLGLNLTDFEFLDVLDWRGPTTPGRIAEHMGLSTGAVTGIVDRMEKLGFVRREPDPDDRRRIIVHLVSRPEVEALYEPMGAAFEEMVAAYSADELKVLIDFLRRANEMMQEQIIRLRGEEAREKQTRKAAASEQT